MAPSQEVAEGYVAVHSTFQVFAVLATAMTLVFYILQIRAGKRGGWEPVYVSSIEFFVYLASFLFPDEYSFVPVNGVTVPLLRYVSWLTTCPIILKVLVTIISDENKPPNYDLILQMMIGITWVELFGLMGFFYTGMLKDVLIVFAFVGMFILYYAIFQTWTNNKAQLSHLKQRSELVALLLCSWLIFPTFYCIGPNMLNYVGNQVSVVGHVFGDLLAKNLWGLLAWRFSKKLKLEAEQNSVKTTQYNLGGIVKNDRLDSLETGKAQLASTEMTIVKQDSKGTEDEVFSREAQMYLMKHYLAAKTSPVQSESKEHTPGLGVREVDVGPDHTLTPSISQVAKESRGQYVGIDGIFERASPVASPQHLQRSRSLESDGDFETRQERIGLP